MLTDTHAHLTFPEFQSDLDGVLARAAAAGVSRIITIGTTVESSRQAVAIAEQRENVFAVVGVHPNSVPKISGDTIAELRELARSPRVVGIGEAGLDYFRLPGGTSDAELAGLKAAQARCFREQLDLAVELGLGVVIHERAAWDDTLAILREYTGRLRVVFHCFGKSPAHAQVVLDLGHLVSFTGIVTFKNAPDVAESARTLPANSFMVETDCPYLAPVPFRGQRCEPAYTRATADHIAALRGVPIETLAAQTEAAANGFFRFPT